MTENHLDGRELRHRTPQERAALGKAARAEVPRSSQAEFAPGPKRPDPLEIIEKQSATRLPELVPVRYGRMSESPFRFYRGAAAIMASDLAETPRTGFRTQLCGDAHMLNFRLLASPERRLMFDINDFDETLPGPWEWDVKRLAASLVIAGRLNGFSTKERAAIVRATVGSYREGMRGFAGIGNLGVWYAQFDDNWVRNQFGADLSARGRDRWARAAAKARSHDTLQVFDKLTHVVDGKRRIVPDPPLITRLEDLMPDDQRGQLEQQIRRLVERYGTTLQSDRRFLLEQYQLADIARKVVGVGSVGTRCWIVLLLGRDDEDPLFLQAKEADQSVLAPHVGDSEYPTQGERVVSGQRLMQATSDILLGWERVEGIDGRRRDFYIRQLRDWKGVAVAEDMVPRGMRTFGALCGATLARAHARSGDRIAIAAYLGGGDTFDRALVTFAEHYADQNERDHQALVDAVSTGKLPAEAA
ncbi:DUF2252 domain-containing protein [Streptomyces sp. NBC_00201]|uniref:DUF2252 domain-containing protein n=1 Tax=unclassified Streptomyces TaxID=2593676 RepID=UPI00225BDCBF|nr:MULTISPECIES: DUF2252 domain-containing protein [unclassified Streptomyces]MCX5057136.1 DUF2252 domain-containing protein [Streptomyces sp. NBC_00452]MCX5245985.1 DUF2252 domain-containing protein [Streptomyces sp. NBC_00201]MCX5288211.1 DUF2252 domain-containing protein [Streptomyces sp. NBC_00183]